MMSDRQHVAFVIFSQQVRLLVVVRVHTETSRVGNRSRGKTVNQGLINCEFTLRANCKTVDPQGNIGDTPLKFK